ncbi:hypothetical protein MUCCIDRAFT_157611 [Mucor lusitanicus CBS 277.49]|uniref:Uncharacterized protein n=1 Tax=Mucor lusitanicus CBS 277.49 TaxID=747725 RepID=A0A162Y5E6_MUCCL|nr:hypothetical protein MUCCIDRAFT_157611 [Mucor lusitanicus CBS 277.49]
MLPTKELHTTAVLDSQYATNKGVAHHSSVGFSILRKQGKRSRKERGAETRAYMLPTKGLHTTAVLDSQS